MGKYPSEEAERFQIRLPDGLRDEISAAASANCRSMNSEIIIRLTAANEDLRDKFAIAALASISTWIPLEPMPPYFHTPDLKSAEAIKARAEWVYEQADAMIIAREGDSK